MKHLLFSFALIFISTLGFAQQTVQVDTTIRIDTTHDPRYKTQVEPVVQQVNNSNSDSDSSVFHYAEVMPEFPGPAGSFQQYLASTIKYPKDEQMRGIQGTVYVSFIVNKDGSISDVKVVKEVPGAPGFSTEAIRAISAMPKWTPGMMNGKPVRIEITQPIRFTLPPKPAGK